VVLSPAPLLYLDNLQSNLPDEPPGRLSSPPQSLALVYAYDPMPKDIAGPNRSHVLGAQMNAWSEYLNSSALAQRATFPRLAAFAEVLWSPSDGRNFPEFLDRLEPQMDRFRRAEIPAADSAFAVAFTLRGGRAAALAQGRAELALSNQTGHGTIRYTADGSEPSGHSSVYGSPLIVPLGTIVRAMTFGAHGQPLAASRQFDTSRAALLHAGPSDLIACPGENQQVRVPLTPDATNAAPAFNINLFDSCFLLPDAPITEARGIAVDAVRVTHNVALAGDFDKVRQNYSSTQFGELIVRTGGCDGQVAAVLPLPDPATAPKQLHLSGPWRSMGKDGDLCLLFATPPNDWTYAVAKIDLSEASR